MKYVSIVVLAVVLSVAFAAAQAPANRSVLGTITSFNSETKAIDVKPDNAAAVPVKLLANTILQRITPGQTDLRNAVAIPLTEVVVGDRVLVTLGSNGADALRLIVMSASDIAKRDEADRQDWAKRGISGIVSAKNGNQVLLKTRTPRGDVQETIATSDKTRFRRYSPDSVKFADAKPSKFEEVGAGDQIRARGEKSPDGLRVDAEEVVFGTFLTRAGTVVSVDAAAREITVKELGSGKSLIVKLTSDSAIKQMPAAADGRGAPAPGNVAQIIESLPAAKLEDVKPGTSIIVSSTKGSQDDRVTAILLVANADLLIRMATTPSGRGGTLVFGAAGGGGLDVLALP
jgi:hypothetical protein